MFKDVVSHSDLTYFATWSLVIFVAVFAGVFVWTVTRSRRQVQTWSTLPLEDDVPAEPRDEKPRKQCKCDGCGCGRKREEASSHA